MELRDKKLKCGDWNYAFGKSNSKSLILIVLFLATSMPFVLRAQSGVTITFTSLTTEGEFEPTDSITVKNLDRGWTETLYYPDTVYHLMIGDDVPDYTSGCGLEVVPNPFDGITTVILTVVEPGDAVFEIMDLAGRVLDKLHVMSLPAGTHSFRVSIAVPGVYLLVARIGGKALSLKMLNTHTGGGNVIEYCSFVKSYPNESLPEKSVPKATSSHPFQLGDRMCYVGHASWRASKAVIQAQSESEELTLVLPTFCTATAQHPAQNDASFHGNGYSGANDGLETVVNGRIDSVTDYEGNEYPVVRIGSQCWLAENLRCTHSPRGHLTLCVNNTSYVGAYYYNYSSPTIPTEDRGLFYNWAAAMDTTTADITPTFTNRRGICPKGWHVPSDVEWNEMLVIAGGGYITLAGEALKSQGGWLSNENTTDALGFSAVPVGYENYEGVFKNMNKYVDFWSSTDIEDGYAYVLMLRSEYDEAHLEYGGKDDAVAVRCVRNEPVASSISLLCSEERESCETFDWSISKEKYLNSNIEYGSFVDSRDGQVYKTVKISNQVWMAQNLNYADSVKTPSLKGRSWCYGDQSEKCKVAGRLYTWSAAIDSVQLAARDCGYGHECAIPSVVQGICPEGWHLPNKSELFTLSATAESNGTGGSALKSQIGWYNNSRNTDTYGFSAIPVGYRSHTGKYLEAGGYMHFWADDEEDAESSYATSLTYTLNSIRILYGNNKNDGLSVRCIKN